MSTTKTLGIEPAHRGALNTLQFFRHAGEGIPAEVHEAAEEISTYHPPSESQAIRHKALSLALEEFLVALVDNCPSGPERSTAISRAREAKMWASAAVALEGL